MVQHKQHSGYTVLPENSAAFVKLKRHNLLFKPNAISTMTLNLMMISLRLRTMMHAVACGELLISAYTSISPYAEIYIFLLHPIDKSPNIVLGTKRQHDPPCWDI
jgi:hypothetical protein